MNNANDDIETWIVKIIRTTNDIKNQVSASSLSLHGFNL